MRDPLKPQQEQEERRNQKEEEQEQNNQEEEEQSVSVDQQCVQAGGEMRTGATLCWTSGTHLPPGSFSCSPRCGQYQEEEEEQVSVKETL